MFYCFRQNRKRFLLCAQNKNKNTTSKKKSAQYLHWHYGHGIHNFCEKDTLDAQILESRQKYYMVGTNILKINLKSMDYMMVQSPPLCMYYWSSGTIMYIFLLSTLYFRIKLIYHSFPICYNCEDTLYEKYDNEYRIAHNFYH